MSDKSKTKSLNSLYENRKKQHRAPTAMKQRLLARKDNLRGSYGRGSWLINALVAGVVGIVFLIIYFQIPVTKPVIKESDNPLLYARIELHSAEGEYSSYSATHRIRYDKAKQVHENAQSAYSKVAKILDTEDGLTLVTCKKDLIKISPTVLAFTNLDEILLQEKNAHKGEIIAISYTDAGQIADFRKPSDITKEAACFAASE